MSQATQSLPVESLPGALAAGYQESVPARREGPPPNLSTGRVLRAIGTLSRREPAGLVGLLIVVGLVFAAIFAPYVAPYDPLQTGLSRPLSPPSAAYLLGTDSLGRDVFSRLIWGARITLGVALVSVFFGTGLGFLVGVVSGYRGGAFDLLVQRIIDSFLAIPTLVLALALTAALGNSLPMLVLVIAITLVPLTARVIRGEALVIRELQYVEAARVTGASDRRIIFRHVVPSVLPTLIVLATIDLGVVMIVEASLSFLGVGAPPPTPSWGQMLNGAATQYFREAPLLAILPGLTITMAVLGVNFLGDGLRNVLDPRQRKKAL